MAVNGKNPQAAVNIRVKSINSEVRGGGGGGGGEGCGWRDPGMGFANFLHAYLLEKVVKVSVIQSLLTFFAKI